MQGSDDEEEPWHPRTVVSGSPSEQKGQLQKGSKSLNSRLAIRSFTSLRRTGFFSDAVIKAGDVGFPVHRNILACCSPYFRALFTDVARTKWQKPTAHDGPDSGDKEELPQPVSRLHYSDNNNVVKFNQSEGLKHKNAGGLSKADEDPSTKLSIGQLVSVLSPDHGTEPSIAYSSAGAGSELPHQYGTQTKGGKLSLDEERNSIISMAHEKESEVPPTSTHSVVEVSIPGVSPEVMNGILEHVYGGNIIITGDNLEGLLIGADRFQIMSLLRKCCEYLESQISVENCISIVKFVSHFYMCEQTRLKGTQFFLDNFVTVSQTCQDYSTLSRDELLAILTADRLNVRHEEQVLDAVIRWVMADPTDRQQHIPQLVSSARVGLMLPDNMKDFVDSWLLSSNLSSEFNRVTLQVMEAVLRLQKQQMLHVDASVFAPRLPRDVLVVVGGSNFGFPLNLVEAFDCRTWLWSIITPQDFAPRSYHGMVALDNEIFIVGGFSGQVYLSSCCKFKPESLTWEPVTPMNTKRCYVGTAVLKGHIYAVGGYDGVYRLNSAERHDKASNQWSFITPMLQQRSDAGVAVLYDKMYVCGGFNGMECIRAVEIYDPHTDQWSAVTSMSQGRSGLGLVAYGGCLYAVGGFDGSDSSVRLSTVERFDPNTSQWTALQPMPHPRSNLAVEVLEDVMYAIGGYNGDRTTSVVECYDFTSNTWFQCTRLSHNRSALSVCVLCGLSNTAELLGRTVQASVSRSVVIPGPGTQ